VGARCSEGNGTGTDYGKRPKAKNEE
jgi:hypothetical protein